MFGFLKPDCSDRQYAEYRRAYARCCRHQNRSFGKTSLLMLSYESVFLYLLGMDAGAFSGPADSDPLCCRLSKKGATGVDEDAAFANFCSSFGLLLVQTKLEDDIRDGWGLLARVGRATLARRFRLARNTLTEASTELLPEVDAEIAEHLRLERSGDRIQMRDYAVPTANAFGHVFAASSAMSLSIAPDVFRRIGQHLGAAIIGFDCSVDWLSDRRRGHFNPLPNREAVLQSFDFANDQIMQAGWLCNDAFNGTLSVSVLRHAVWRIRAHRKRFENLPDTLLNPNGRRWFSTRGRSPMPSRAGFCDCDCIGCDGLCDVCDAGDACRGSRFCCDASSCCDVCDCFCQDNSKRKSKQAVIDQAGDVEQPTDQWVGREGTVTSSLVPMGMIEIDGDEHPAKSEQEMLTIGLRVRVVRSESFGLVVKPIEDQ